MGLNDLMNEIKQDPNCLTGDETFEVKIVKHVIALVEDKISEVKNQAAKWCVFVYLIELLNIGELTTLQSGANHEDHKAATNGNGSR